MLSRPPQSPTWTPELRPLERKPQAQAQGQVENFLRPWGGPPAILDREAFLLYPYGQPGPPGMPCVATAETSPAWSLQLLKCLYQYQRENAKRLLTPPKECSSSLALGLGPLPPHAQLWALKGLRFNLGLCDRCGGWDPEGRSQVGSALHNHDLEPGTSPRRDLQNGDVKLLNELMLITRGPMHRVRAGVGLRSRGSFFHPLAAAPASYGRTSGLMSIAPFYYYR